MIEACKLGMKEDQKHANLSATAICPCCVLTDWCADVQPTAQEIVDSYADIMTERYTTRMARKLGLKEYRKELSVGLITLMYEDKADFTNKFRAMASVSASDEPGSVPEALDQVSCLLRAAYRVPVIRARVWWGSSL